MAIGESAQRIRDLHSGDRDGSFDPKIVRKRQRPARRGIRYLMFIALPDGPRAELVTDGVTPTQDRREQS
jgi:hypothetical protein